MRPFVKAYGLLFHEKHQKYNCNLNVCTTSGDDCQKRYIGLRLWAFGGISTLQRSLRRKRQFSDVGLRVCLILSSLTAAPLPFLVTPFINTTLGASATTPPRPPPPVACGESRPLLSNLELLLSGWSGQSGLYLRHRGSSLPALERHPTSPKTAGIR